MPMNNNQKVPSAAARLSRLPVVRTACGKLWLLYADTKRSHPGLRTVCEALEERVAALGTAASVGVSPVIVKLEPHISTANDMACKSLDWLEAKFPVLHTPTEQIVATAVNKMHEIQAVVSIAASGTVDCVQHTVSWVMERMQQADDGTDHTVVERALGVASVGLDSALNMADALVDRAIPPTEEDQKEAAAAAHSAEAAALRRSYHVRLVSLTVKLCQRTFHVVGGRLHSVQVGHILSLSLVQDLQTTWVTLVWGLQELPQYLQHQAVSVLFFISQMYNLGNPTSEQNQSSPVTSPLKAGEVSVHHKAVVKVPPQAPPSYRLRHIKVSADKERTSR